MLGGVGIKHVYNFSAKYLDLVPVDIVSNSAILAAFHTAVNPLAKPEIFQAASSKINPPLLG